MIDNFDRQQNNPVLDERFELLSAYLDGEVTTSERQQVEALLASDLAFEQQYRQMQQLQQAFDRLPVPSIPSAQSAQSLATDVFAKIDRQRQRRWMWCGGGAIAATLVATVAGLSGIFAGDRAQFANNPERPVPLMVALNDPILSIPAKIDRAIEVPMSSPEVNVD